MTIPDITMIAIEELRIDLRETLEDINYCVLALESGIYQYGDMKSVAERLRVNGQIAERISVELQRREP